MDKKGLAGRAFINYSELRALFPLLRETTIRGKLVNECQCEIVRVCGLALVSPLLIGDCLISIWPLDPSILYFYLFMQERCDMKRANC